MFNTPRLGEKLIMLFPVWMGIVGTVLAIFASDPFGSKIFAGIALLVVGFASFFKAKLRNLREGQLTSFGVKELNLNEKKLYFLGYFLMTLGLAIEVYLAATV